METFFPQEVGTSLVVFYNSPVDVTYSYNWSTNDSKEGRDYQTLK